MSIGQGNIRHITQSRISLHVFYTNLDVHMNHHVRNFIFIRIVQYVHEGF